tara:strand:- start:208 stop:2103 length:1896 start_codon:yes stop_codon:yes gene_type:complete
MCGLSGILNFEKTNPRSIDLVNKMNQKIIHRGPDSDGLYRDAKIVLGFRRLKIIDLFTGDQPIANRDKTIWAIVNGEIYNFKSLRYDLEKLGYQFKTNTDIEVIVHGYEEYGSSFISQLRGMFAIAIWDSNNKCLLLARDRLGKKPLFYSEQNNEIFFSSGMKALLEIEDISREINLSSLNDYLTLQCIPAPLSILKDVKKLPPGHLLIADCKDKSVRLKKYWELDYLPKQIISFKEAKDALIIKLKDAVKIRMTSDVPIGALLSGGVDSSVIVGLMSEISNNPVHTFSIGFDDKEYDESQYAQQIADRFGTIHKQLYVRPDAIEVIPHIVEMLDEPMADSSAVPTYYVSKLSKEFVTVVLNGDGGDEVFSGYNRYGKTLLLSRLLKMPRLFKTLVNIISNVIPNNINHYRLASKIKTLDEIKDLSFEEHFLRQTLLWNEKDRKLLFNGSIYNDIEKDNTLTAEQEILNLLKDNNDLDKIDKMLIADINGYLPNDLLVKMDRMSMAHSLEARSPFLDHELIEFVAKLPSNYKRQMNNGKLLLKSAFKDLLPNNILNRKKQGFGVPIEYWLRNELKEMMFDELLSKSSNNLKYFDKPFIEKMLIEHVNEKRDYSNKIWSLLIFEIWHKQYLG